MPMYNLIEYSNNCSKISGSLWQYYRDEPALTDAGAPDNSSGNSVLFKYKQKITSSTGNNGTKNVEIMFPLKYLSNVWRTLEMSLINCEISLILTWYANCVISSSAQATTFVRNDTNLYVPVITLSIDDYAKLLQQVKSRFERTITWNKYEKKNSNTKCSQLIFWFFNRTKFSGCH